MTRKITVGLLMLVMSQFAVGATAVYQCRVNGAVSFQSTPCAAGNAAQPAKTPQSSSAQPSQSSRAMLRCDGRKYCSQMSSCAEAKYFLANCPNTEMDGDHDGIPCESQWCEAPLRSPGANKR